MLTNYLQLNPRENTIPNNNGSHWRQTASVGLQRQARFARVELVRVEMALPIDAWVWLRRMAGRWEGGVKMDIETLTFLYQFSRSVQCEFRIADQAPEPGQLLGPIIIWTERPKRRRIPASRQWGSCLLPNTSPTAGKLAFSTRGEQPLSGSNCGGSHRAQPPQLNRTLNVGIPEFL